MEKNKIDIKYTLCFIKRDNEFLMLNRIKAPNMGLWNGVGGKLELNEDKFQGIKRETAKLLSFIELVHNIPQGSLVNKPSLPSRPPAVGSFKKFSNAVVLFFTFTAPVIKLLIPE